jgi:hypothetical protein
MVAELPYCCVVGELCRVAALLLLPTLLLLLLPLLLSQILSTAPR